MVVLMGAGWFLFQHPYMPPKTRILRRLSFFVAKIRKQERSLFADKHLGELEERAITSHPRCADKPSSVDCTDSEKRCSIFLAGRKTLLQWQNRAAFEIAR